MPGLLQSRCASFRQLREPCRTVNCLEEQAIFTIKALLNCTSQQLLEIPNFGEKTLQAGYDALEQGGGLSSFQATE